MCVICSCAFAAEPHMCEGHETIVIQRINCWMKKNRQSSYARVRVYLCWMCFSNRWYTPHHWNGWLTRGRIAIELYTHSQFGGWTSLSFFFSFLSLLLSLTLFLTLLGKEEICGTQAIRMTVFLLFLASFFSTSTAVAEMAALSTTSMVCRREMLWLGIIYKNIYLASSKEGRRNGSNEKNEKSLMENGVQKMVSGFLAIVQTVDFWWWLAWPDMYISMYMIGTSLCTLYSTFKWVLDAHVCVHELLFILLARL